MARTKGSKNKPKAAKKASAGNGGDGRPLAVTDNGHPQLSDEQRQVLWFRAKPRIVALRNKLESITGEIRNEYKKVKSDLGLTKADIDFALSLADDDGKVQAAWRRRQELARWEQHPIGMQADLFAAESAIHPYGDGKKAGMAGERCEPPHDPSTEAGQVWISGWYEGQAALTRDGIKPTEDEEDVRPRFLLQPGASAAEE
jgi:hypothetical protein